jgi:RHH-type transcriptional regulator, proline utilization regulon repressor / proline dehydrogenase / delta 1-pyrroline-5-carboxylate dehydrogenase
MYSPQPSHLYFSRANLHAGNIYLNRKTSDALVERQSFGGHKMSAAGSKAGGEEYFAQSMDVYCVCENALRRDFSPDDSA